MLVNCRCILRQLCWGLERSGRSTTMPIWHLWCTVYAKRRPEPQQNSLFPVVWCSGVYANDYLHASYMLLKQALFVVACSPCGYVFLYLSEFGVTWNRVPTHPWKYLNFFLLNSRPWKYLKTGQVLESPWISFHRSLKVLEFTKSECAISAALLNKCFA